MVKIIPVASGKGGVGKSTLTASLAVLLAQAGKTVVCVDLDLGGSNLHTCLGVKNTREGISSFIYRRETDLGNLVVETPFPHLFLIPGDGLVPGTANLPFFIKKKLIQGLGNLVADVVLVDLGSGTSHNVLDFFLISTLGMVVTAPETTSILNAYSLIKSALYRSMALAFPGKSMERALVEHFSTQKLEGTGKTVMDLIHQLGENNSQAGQKAYDILRSFHPGVVINMGRTQGDLSLAGKLREIVEKNLTIRPSYQGFLTWEDTARQAVNTRVPLAALNPQSAFSRNLQALAASVLNLVEDRRPQLYWEESPEDLEKLRVLNPELLEGADQESF